MPFTTQQTSLNGVLIIKPSVFADDRGFFYESFNQRDFNSVLNTSLTFVQDNHSQSKRNVLRGLHYQIKLPQGKLVRVTRGEVFDVIVNLQRGHSQFGHWVGVHLSAENKRQIWIPPGFAHGFLILSEVAEFMYKTTDYYAPEHERSLLWSDPAIGIEWPLSGLPILSHKDAGAPSLAQADLFDLP
jgi:dTDP-4-dehydrorhamnose 3,5-epimerase